MHLISSSAMFDMFRSQQVVSGNLNNLTQSQRMQLPGQQEPAEEEPLYVNAKQYHRILKRRQARAKLEAEGKIPRTRKVIFCCFAI